MVDPTPREGPDPDRRVDDLVRGSGWVWPERDEQLDAWLATHALPADEEAWLRDVVLRRTAEARGSARIGSAVSSGGGGAPIIDKSPLATAKSEPASPQARPATTAPRLAPRRLAAEDLVLLDAQLVELVAARVPLPAGLAAYATDLQGGRLASTTSAIRADLEAGLPLSEALGRRGDVLPPVYRALVAAGEATGDLAGCLELLHEQAQVDAELDRRLREALVYPALSGALAVTILLGAAALLGPQTRALFGPMELPALTEVALFICDVLHAAPALTVVCLVGALFAARAALAPRLPGLLRRVSEGPGRTRSLAELSRVLAGFIGRGVPLPAALRALRDAFPALAAEGLDASVARAEGGSSLAEALAAAPIFPPTFVWLVGAAEARGDLGATLHGLAIRYERDFRRRVGVVHAAAGPLALLGVGLVVVLITAVVYLPLFSYQRALQS